VLALLALAGAIVVAATWRAPWSRLGWNPVSPEAAAAIRGCPGRLYNKYADGGYLVWFVPEQPVFLDGRQDPYPLAFLQRASFARSDRAARTAMFAEYGIRCAALSPRSLLVPSLRAEGWSERYADDRWVVLAR